MEHNILKYNKVLEKFEINFILPEEIKQINNDFKVQLKGVNNQQINFTVLEN